MSLLPGGLRSRCKSRVFYFSTDRHPTGCSANSTPTNTVFHRSVFLGAEGDEMLNLTSKDTQEVSVRRDCRDHFLAPGIIKSIPNIFVSFLLNTADTCSQCTLSTNSMHTHTTVHTQVFLKARDQPLSPDSNLFYLLIILFGTLGFEQPMKSLH